MRQTDRQNNRQINRQNDRQILEHCKKGQLRPWCFNSISPPPTKHLTFIPPCHNDYQLLLRCSFFPINMGIQAWEFNCSQNNKQLHVDNQVLLDSRLHFPSLSFRGGQGWMRPLIFTASQHIIGALKGGEDCFTCHNFMVRLRGSVKKKKEKKTYREQRKHPEAQKRTSKIHETDKQSKCLGQ